MPTWVTMREAADDTGVTAEAVRKWVRAGKVKHRTRGRAWLVPIEQVRTVAAAAPRQRVTETAPPGMALVTLAEAQRNDEMARQFVDIADRLGDAERARGRAEQAAEDARRQADELRAERDRLADELDRLRQPWWRRRGGR